MNKEEFFALDATAAAKELNGLIEEGKSEQEAMDEFGITKADLMKAQIFFVKGRFIARAWGGYTSTKATGNEISHS